MTKWILYNLNVGFAVYWMSNLILWFPWSVSPLLGMILMLTVSPIIWTISAFLCLPTYPGNNLMFGAVQNSIIFLVLAVVMDYIFFGLIRNAMEKLYHPTTFYGYGFIACLPFIAVLGFGQKIEQKKRDVNRSDFVKAITIGLTCFILITLIIILRIEL